MPSSPVVAKGETVVVAGAFGFIGAAVTRLLLQSGFKVRGTTRSAAKAEAKRAALAQFGDLEVVEIPDWQPAGAYDAVLRGAAGFVVVAADVSFSTDSAAVERQTREAVTHVLDSAAQSPTVKRVVLTSSNVAAFWPQPGDTYVVDASTWNDGIVPFAHGTPADSPLKAGLTYALGKYVGEKTALEYVKEKSPRFTLTTVLPGLTLGDSPVNQSTGKWANDIFLGDKDSPLMGFLHDPAHFVDVNDVARLHLAGLIEPDVVNERLHASAEAFTINDWLAIWRKRSPERAFPADFTGNFAQPCQLRLDHARSQELLRRQGRDGFGGLEQAMLGNLQRIL